ncbi:MAG: pentapeptide repeat-containing protein [Methanosarcina barkeri]|nr:pentapeptide repeat-containing protein [Methanosarcina sp. ERenArc_MAG2]
MALRESNEKYKKAEIPSLSVVYEKARQRPGKYIFLVFIFILIFFAFVQIIPEFQVSRYEITNTTSKADLENQYRVTFIQFFTTLAQLIGGGVLLFGLYFTWENIIIAKEGQITERFTKAIDQLGDNSLGDNSSLVKKLGGIYALERISKESDKDYWSIMEILTAYIRKNSLIEQNISLDISAILTVIKRRRCSFNLGETNGLDLQGAYLREADLQKANFAGVNLEGANLQGANLQGANLQGAKLSGVVFEKAKLQGANLQNACLKGVNLLVAANLQNAELAEANLQKANLQKANLKGAKFRKKDNWAEANLKGANLKGTNLNGAQLQGVNLTETNLQGANLEGANLEEANLEEANLNGANLERVNLEKTQNLSFNQLSNVKTLYNAKLNEELFILLKDKYPALFKRPNWVLLQK